MLPRTGPDAPWPTSLWVVRHGESAGNVASDAAEAHGHDRLDLSHRDVDVPLSGLGERQARALGRWIADQREDERPTVLWTSPFVRARQTAEMALETAGLDLPRVVDERLREREFGVLDGLTRRGIAAHYPEESARRAAIGKFYHRPPGGESWTDVLQRLRAVLDDIRLDADGERVLLMAHQVVVLLTRYVLEGMNENQVLALDAEAEVLNCAVTAYRHDAGAGRLVLERYNEAAPLDELPRGPASAEALITGGLGAGRVGAARPGHPAPRGTTMSEQPATSAGTTSPAGEGVGDEELTEQVADQTSSDLEVEGVFEREADGASTDTEAAKATGDELQ